MAKDTGQASSEAPGTGPVGKEGHTVKQGECVESIAFEHGLFWETVWNDPKNAELKDARGNPNALLPGDKLYVRDMEEKDEPCEAEQKHRFRRKGIPCMLRLVLCDQGEPRANQDYELEIDGEVFTGKTDANGLLEQGILPNAKEGKLAVGTGADRMEYVLNLRQLDPADEPSGVQQRLNNMGYDAGKVDGTLNDQTRSALSRFQADNDLEPTGELDDETVKKLMEVHNT
ncbi:MAG: PGRP and LysM peptidoglycan-binding domain-containing protein [Planctomycetota bacterium]|jgi:N-acetylmuramoyl-L-alanine amidase